MLIAQLEFEAMLRSENHHLTTALFLKSGKENWKEKKGALLQTMML